MGYELDFGVLLTYWPVLWRGVLYTVLATLFGIIGGNTLGITAGAMWGYKIPGVRQAVSAYVAFFRYTPILVQIFFLYYALPSIGLRFTAFQVAALSLVLWGSAYNAANFRAAMGAVPAGLRQSAAALGMPRFETFRSVVLPIGIRIYVPSAINTSISILKNSAYLSAIGFAEMTYVSTNIIANDFRVFEMFLFMGIVYLGLVFVLSALARHFHGRLETRGTVAN